MQPPLATPTHAGQEPAADRTLLTTRLIAATPARIYTAFVTPERLARWWGPKDFRNTFEACEPTAGGTWRFVMHAPNGAEYRQESVFETLVPGERIVIRHASGPQYTLTVTLEREGAGTRLTWRQVFDSAAHCESLRRIAVPANEENLDRLEAELARASA